MRSPALSRVFRLAGFVVLALAVGFLGLRAGRWMRERRAPAPAAADAKVSEFPFEVGAPFPDVAVMDSTGATRQTRDLVTGSGAVVLFIDLECEACQNMCHRWEDAVEQGWIDADRIVAIAREAPAMVEQYRKSNALRFPIYRDPELVFSHTHGVVRFPLELIVGVSGTIRSESYDSVSPIDEAALHQKLLE